MATYTAQDLLNAQNYSKNRRDLILLKLLYEKYPHIASHLKCTITRANAETDYYYPNSMADWAVKVKIDIAQQACDMLSCNTATPDGTCDHDSVCRYYRVGETDTYERTCNPACYNLLNKPIYDDNGNETVQSYRYRWNSEKQTCDFVPSASTWLELPYYRSSEIYETRVNDLALGFDRDPIADTYRYNKYYCDVYFDKYDEVNHTCYEAWYDKIAGAVIGSNIMKMVKAGITQLKNGNGSTLPPSGLPEPPAIEDSWLVSNWKKNINDDFALPDINVGVSGNVLEKSTPSHLKGKLNENPNSGVVVRKKRSIKTLIRSSSDDAGTGGDDSEKTLGDNVKEILLNILESIFSVDTLEAIGIDFAVTQLSSSLKNLSIKVIENLIPKLMVFVSKTSVSVAERVFSASLINITKMAFEQVAFKVAGTAMTFLVKSLALASTGIGILLLVVQMFDLLFTFWDPLGFQTKYPPEYLESLYDQSKYALREQMNTTNVNLTFEILCSYMLSEDELLSANIESYVYMYQYLDSLEVNSNGSRLDKGDILDTSDSSSVDIAAPLAQLKIYNSEEFDSYEKDHVSRRNLYTKLDNYLKISLALGALFALFKLYTFSILAFLISVSVVTLMYCNMQYNVSMLFDKLKIPNIY